MLAPDKRELVATYAMHSSDENFFATIIRSCRRIDKRIAINFIMMLTTVLHILNTLGVSIRSTRISQACPLLLVGIGMYVGSYR